MSKKLTVLGSINADHVISVPYFAKPGETLTGSNYHIAYGGKGANQAVAAARLGGNVSFIACIGDDDIGRAMKKAFEQDGIHTDSVIQIADEMSGIAMIQVAANGENSIIISAGANAHLNEPLVEQYCDLISQSDCLLMQLETPLDAVIKAAKIAKSAKTKVILNPAPAHALPDELLSQLDMITPNETEAKILTGVDVTDQKSAVKAAEIFHQKGIETVLITLGAKGVFYSQNGKGELIDGFRVKAKDTTAAGDTFNGALAVALLEGQPINEAIRFAQAAAAISVTREGAQSSIPTKAETLAFLNA
ncbi:ribokinase [Cricetibacter osteomyelitidis]|uniref:Ribokinase n=1 Tax=Cricetibacter osteomyelitidis TaxID=1521931 RepID=A0A4R2T288_9PAST|nr:ribokinase [Cricetibacter osteomyelitidis]TCP96290.1 ribokinase [Cricetibacter osteomyelitidis]